MSEDIFEDDNQTLREMKDAFGSVENMLESPGWEVLGKYVAQQIEARTQTLVFADITHDEMIRLRSEISAIYTFKELPTLILEELQSNIKAREVELAANKEVYPNAD
jgi:hypothetical protein